MKANSRLQTTLDRLPYGEEILSNDLKVNNKLPEGVKSKELYNFNKFYFLLDNEIYVKIIRKKR